MSLLKIITHVLVDRHIHLFSSFVSPAYYQQPSKNAQRKVVPRRNRARIKKKTSILFHYPFKKPEYIIYIYIYTQNQFLQYPHKLASFPIPNFIRADQSLILPDRHSTINPLPKFYSRKRPNASLLLPPPRRRRSSSASLISHVACR